MTQKNEIPALILALGTTLLLLGGGYWWLTRHTELGRNLSQSIPQAIPETSPNTAPNRPGQSPLEQRFSAGERLLIAGVASAEKQAGISAIAAGDFTQAVSALEASLQQNRNDPEALVYLNNARIGSGQNYTLAVAVPTTTSVDPAQEILRGVAQAQQQVNESGGINGVPIRILIVNDDNAPAVAAQVAETLVQDPTVLGVVGHFGSETSLAAGEVYQRGGLVMVSPTSTAVGLSGFGDAIFRTVPSDRFTATTLSRYLVNSLQERNVAIYFNADSDYSQSLKNELTTALLSDGGQVVAEINVAEPSFNARGSLDQASQQGAEVLVLATNTSTLNQALQVVEANQARLPLLGGDSLYNPQLLQRGGADAADMVVTVPWILLSNPNTPFVATARQLWGGDVNWRTAMAYDAVLAIAAGLAPNPSRSGLQATLSGAGFTTEGATGTIRFLPSGDRNQAMQLVQVRPGTRSGYGYDFVPVQP
ncbi:MAG: ABC transporter substrate-binding protein [Cyanobacteria bacterium Co-bin13]|nr:ABC transporter substrate-binding protein [Cyanobacteria bacterium Co-bin13]